MGIHRREIDATSLLTKLFAIGRVLSGRPVIGRVAWHADGVQSLCKISEGLRVAVIRQFCTRVGMAEYFQGNPVPQGIAVRSTA